MAFCDALLPTCKTYACYIFFGILSMFPEGILFSRLLTKQLRQNTRTRLQNTYAHTPRAPPPPPTTGHAGFTWTHRHAHIFCPAHLLPRLPLLQALHAYRITPPCAFSGCKQRKTIFLSALAAASSGCRAAHSYGLHTLIAFAPPVVGTAARISASYAHFGMAGTISQHAPYAAFTTAHYYRIWFAIHGYGFIAAGNCNRQPSQLHCLWQFILHSRVSRRPAAWRTRGGRAEKKHEYLLFASRLRALLCRRIIVVAGWFILPSTRLLASTLSLHYRGWWRATRHFRATTPYHLHFLRAVLLPSAAACCAAQQTGLYATALHARLTTRTSSGTTLLRKLLPHLQKYYGSSTTVL